MIKLLRTIVQCFRDTPVDQAECAITRAANLAAEAHREYIKANYYTCMLLDIDPHTEWNLFARIKQLQYDTQHAYTRLQERANKANIRAEARVEAMKEQPDEPATDPAVLDTNVFPIAGFVSDPLRRPDLP